MRRSLNLSGDLLSFYDRPSTKVHNTMQQELSLLYQKLQFINSMMVDTEPVQNYVDFSKWFNCEDNMEEEQHPLSQKKDDQEH